MTTTTKVRHGLSEPSRYSSKLFRMGTTIRVGIEGLKDATMMISAIIARNDPEDDRLYALLTAHSRIPPYDGERACALVRERGKGERLHIGTLVMPDTVLGPDSEKLGFHVLALDRMPLLGTSKESARSLSTVNNFRKNIWGRGTFSVRRLNDPSAFEERFTVRKQKVYLCNKKGQVAGEIESVYISDLGKTLEYSYCGTVTRGRMRPLAESKGLGAPVISENGALSGIIVGAAENDTLVYPVEELKRDCAIDFVTLGEDWPKVKIIENSQPVRRER